MHDWLRLCIGLCHCLPCRPPWSLRLSSGMPHRPMKAENPVANWDGLSFEEQVLAFLRQTHAGNIDPQAAQHEWACWKRVRAQHAPNETPHSFALGWLMDLVERDGVEDGGCPAPARSSFYVDFGEPQAFVQQLEMLARQRRLSINWNGLLESAAWGDDETRRDVLPQTMLAAFRSLRAQGHTLWCWDTLGPEYASGWMTASADDAAHRALCKQLGIWSVARCDNWLTRVAPDEQQRTEPPPPAAGCSPCNDFIQEGKN